MIFNDCWKEFNDNIQSQTDRDFLFKIRAINLGNNYLATRIATLINPESIPGELKAGVTSLSNDATSNKFTLPSDYLYFLNAWYKNSSVYNMFDNNQRYDFSSYLKSLDSNFFDTTFTGTPTYFSISEPYFYTDKYFTALGTDNIKIDYVKVPATLYGYSQLNVDTAPASFAIGETVTGSTSGATGVIYSKGTGYIRFLINDVSTTVFEADETVTCSGSVDSATVTTFVDGSETLMLGAKYKTLLIESWGLEWHILKGSDEIEARSETVDYMIQSASSMNRIQVSSWGY